MADGVAPEDAMQRVRARFLTTLAEYLETLDDIGAAIDSGRATVDDVIEARHVLHRIAGSAGTLGRTELGAAARACESRLPRHKRPKWIRVVAELPRTGTGKVQRFRLREMLEREIERQR